MNSNGAYHESNLSSYMSLSVYTDLNIFKLDDILKAKGLTQTFGGLNLLL